MLSNPAARTAPEDEKFCEVAFNTLDGLTPLNSSIKSILFNYLGLKTEMHEEFLKNITLTRQIGMEKVDKFREKEGRGELDEFQKNSYLANAFRRQRDGGNIGDDELKELSFVILMAS